MVGFYHLRSLKLLVVFFYRGATATRGPVPPPYRGFTITLRYTTLGRTPLDERAARCRDVYLTTHIIHKTDNHAPDGIGTRNTRKPVATGIRKFFFRNRIRWLLRMILYINPIFFLTGVYRFVVINGPSSVCEATADVIF
jgi:hypothetical protein